MMARITRHFDQHGAILVARRHRRSSGPTTRSECDTARWARLQPEERLERPERRLRKPLEAVTDRDEWQRDRRGRPFPVAAMSIRVVRQRHHRAATPAPYPLGAAKGPIRAVREISWHFAIDLGPCLRSGRNRTVDQRNVARGPRASPVEIDDCLLMKNHENSTREQDGQQKRPIGAPETRADP